eukprot:jgi/Hompol1/688/HPOL_000809-RA
MTNKKTATAATTATTTTPATAATLAPFANFLVLPITVPPPTIITQATHSLTQHMTPKTLANFSPTMPSTTHYIYLREHISRKEPSSSSSLSAPSSGGEDTTLARGRTIFLVNLPVDTNVMHLRRLFRRCGVIERVVWKTSAMAASATGGMDPTMVLGGGSGSNSNGKGGNNNNNNNHDDGIDESIKSAQTVISETLVHRARGWIHTTGAHAHVVFEDAESVQRVLAMKPRRRLWSDVMDDDEDLDESMDGGDQQKSGNPLEWILKHLAMYPDTSNLQTQVDQAMSMFDDAQDRAKQELLRQHNMPDEDGFVTVTRVGRKNISVDAQGASVTALSAEAAKQLKPKNKGLVDFYRFQRREEKRNELAELRRKFEEDKLKIETLKTKRRFKPY